MSDREIPSFFHIGMPKSGSSFLYNLLKQHQKVSLGKIQKINFYGDNFQKGWQWYHDLFETRPGCSMIDTSPKLFMQGEAAARRIKKFVPDPKFLLIVRNPVDYVFSHYRMHFNSGFFVKQHGDKFRRNPSFDEVIEKFPEYLSRGDYFEMMKSWLNHFDLADFMVVAFENFTENPQKTIDQICDFYKISRFRIRIVKHSSRNVAMRNPLFHRIKMMLNKNKKLKRLLQKISLADKLYSFLLTNPTRISDRHREFLESYYYDEIIRFADLLKADLSVWLT